MEKTQYVYLAGSVAGLTYEEANVWRIQFSEMMPSWIQCMSPMRGVGTIAESATFSETGYNHPLFTNDGITARDRLDVGRCDLMIANYLGAKSKSLGTAVEFGWAKPPNGRQVPIVMVIEDDNVNYHGRLVSLADYIVPSLEEAARIAVGVLTPSVEVDLDWWSEHGDNS